MFSPSTRRLCPPLRFPLHFTRFVSAILSLLIVAVLALQQLRTAEKANIIVMHTRHESIILASTTANNWERAQLEGPTSSSLHAGLSHQPVIAPAHAPPLPPAHASPEYSARLSSSSDTSAEECCLLTLSEAV